MNDKTPGLKHKFSWLIEKFWPIPGWSENWQDDWQKVKHCWRKENGDWFFDYDSVKRILGE